MKIPSPIIIHIFWNKNKGIFQNNALDLKGIGHYRPHIRFKGINKMWGVELDIKTMPCYDKPTIAIIENSLEHIPVDLIKIGEYFDILEGPQVVGEGRIIEILS